jgi:hypothetical protein
VQSRDRAEETDGVRVLRFGEERIHRGALHDPPGVHHRHVLGELSDDAQVVGDEDDRRPVLVAQHPHELEDLRLDGDVRARRRARRR